MKYLIAVMLAVSVGAAHASADLAKSKNCLACHAVDKKLVGPAFKDVAARYTQKDVAQLAATIRKGGVGKWGPIPMPAHPQVPEQDIKTIVHWVLSL